MDSAKDRSQHRNVIVFPGHHPDDQPLADGRLDQQRIQRADMVADKNCRAVVRKGAVILNFEAMIESREEPIARFQNADADRGFGILPGFFLLFVTAHGLREIPELAALRQRLL